MIKILLISATLFLPFCERTKETVLPKKTTAKLTILVAEEDGSASYSASDKYAINIFSSDGSYSKTTTEFYFSGEVPTNKEMWAYIDNSNWFHGTRQSFTVTKDTTFTLKINAGYRWRKAQ